METLNGFDFFRLHFDADGNLPNMAEFTGFEQHAAAGPSTDAIFLAHGFRNSEDDAMGLYTGFLNTFRGHVDSGALPSLRDRKFVVAGVFWPSKPFNEGTSGDGSTQAVDADMAAKQDIVAKLQDLRATVATAAQQPKLDRAIELVDALDSRGAQDEFVDCVLTLLRDTDLDATEGMETLLTLAGSTLLDRLGQSSQVAKADDDGNDGGVASLDPSAPGEDETGGSAGLGSVFGSIAGRVGQFLNFTTWYVMKARSGTVGATGVAKAVRDLKTAVPNIRVHLVGHSLGGRLMAACAKSLGAGPKLQPDSVTLLEAAFSHYGFSANNGKGESGFFRSVVDNQVVKGPFIATFSAQDDVVGNIYAIASRLVDDDTKAVGGPDDMFGGIGHNGAQRTAEATAETLHAIGTAYQFQPGKIQCLDGSNGLIKDHGDVKNAVVTFAFASAVAATAEASQAAVL
jgi:pimeloyl-ACP methyl ester carboxylesterase